MYPLEARTKANAQPQARAIATHGVCVDMRTFDSDFGNEPALDIPYIALEEDISSIRTVLLVAKSAIPDRTAPPLPPNTFPAARAIGASEDERACQPTSEIAEIATAI